LVGDETDLCSKLLVAMVDFAYVFILLYLFHAILLYRRGFTEIAEALVFCYVFSDKYF